MKHLASRLKSFVKARKLDVVLAGLLMLAGGTVSAVNMAGYPQRFEDEGTYISQAWAIKEQGALTHYTYWYDHPPAGWIQMAAHLVVTDALDRYGSAISAGREFMLILHIATIGLLYALARRLKIGSIAAATGVLLFAFSPLVVEFSRYVLLDNVAVPWLLAAFILALSPRRSLLAAVGSALCMAIAILSKETFLVLLPVLAYAMWYASDARNRRYVMAAFGVVLVSVCMSYVLYAALKNELFPGEGHVSLLGTFFWQLLGREGSGSIFNSGSGTRGLVGYWLNIDYWLLAAGTISAVVALFYKHLRPAAFGMLISLALLLRSGYLPYPYVIILLPFAALSIAGILDQLVVRPVLRGKAASRYPALTAAVVMIAGLAVFVAPSWQPKLAAITTQDQDASSRQAVGWISQNIGRDSRMVVESALWTDLQDKGFNRPDPVWLYKTETDPEVSKAVGGWQGIDYVILNSPTVGSKGFGQAFPTVNTAIENSKLEAEFGSDNQKILVYKVQR